MLVYFPRIFWLFFILIYLHAYSEVFATEPAVECMDRTENNRCDPHCTPDSE